MAKLTVLSLLVLVLVLVPGAMLEEDLYKILGVGRSATSKQIKTAYRRLAKEWYVSVGV